MAEPLPAQRRELEAAERALYAAMTDRDIATLERMLRPDVRFVHSTAVVEDRAAYLAGIAANRYRYDRITAHPGFVRVADDIAVMMGLVEMAVSGIGGPNTTLRLQVTLIWNRIDGDWRLMLRQATRIP